MVVCAPETSRGFAKGVGVRVDRLGSDNLRGLKINVITPTGVSYSVGRDERFKPTPFGVDVEVLQAGRSVARLGVAARCDGGQASRCRFKTISMRR